MKGRLICAALIAITTASTAHAQDSLPGYRFSNAGVLRAGSATDSVFVARTRAVDTINIADFASFLLAKLGGSRLYDSLAFKVTSDSQRVRISGRIMDFPTEFRSELGPMFSFLDSTSVFVAEISMPQADSGIMVFRLERITVRGLAIPDLLVLAALSSYRARYPDKLAAGGKEFHVEIPREAHARLATDSIVLRMPPKP
jgi:hypothetical protein